MAVSGQRAEVAGRRSSQRLSVSGSTASLTSTDSRYEYDAHPKTETSGITDEHTEYLRRVGDMTTSFY